MCLKDFPRPTDVTGGHMNAYFDNLLYVEKKFPCIIVTISTRNSLGPNAPPLVQ